MPTFQNRSATVRSRPSTSGPNQLQRRRMILALAVLLVTLGLVVVKDRQLLLPPPNEEGQPATAPGTIAAPTETRIEAGARHVSTSTIQAPIRTIKVSTPPVPHNSVPAIGANMGRSDWPPLEVEVVAGNPRPQGDGSANTLIERMQDSLGSHLVGQDRPAAVATQLASERVELSPGTARIVDTSVKPGYPVLAKEMKVQGPVMLEALVSETGAIEDIQVLSGPAILSAAARDAIQQWKFKPYLRNGRPVESHARITVNFVIPTY